MNQQFKINLNILTKFIIKQSKPKPLLSQKLLFSHNINLQIFQLKKIHKHHVTIPNKPHNSNQFHTLTKRKNPKSMNSQNI